MLTCRTRRGAAIILSLTLGCGSGGSDHDPAPTLVPTPAPTPSPVEPSPIPTASTSPQAVLWVTGCGSNTSVSCDCTRIGNYCERGVLARSDDLGETWTRLYVDVGLGGVAFATAREGFAVGPRGVVLHTDDGGGTWTRKEDGIELPAEATARGVNAFDAVRFFDAQRGIITGWGTTEEQIGQFGPVAIYRTQVFVLFTEDGGTTWRPAPIDGAPAIDGARGASACFTETGIGIIARVPPLLSHDAGRTWRSIATETGLGNARGAACTGAQTIWLSVSSRVVRSDDGGLTWMSLGDEGFNCCHASLDFTSELRGWRAGESVQRTDDGGTTWTTVDAAIPAGFGTSALRFATANDGLWVGTGAGGVTHDGGVTWQPVIVVPFRDGIFGLSDVTVVGAGASR